LDRISREELFDAHYLVSGIIRAGIVIVIIGDGMIFDRSNKERMMLNLLISLVVLTRSSDDSDSKSRNGVKHLAAKRANTEASGIKLSAMTPAWIDAERTTLGKKVIGRKFSLNRDAGTVKRIFELHAQGLGRALIVQKLIAEVGHRALSNPVAKALELVHVDCAQHVVLAGREDNRDIAVLAANHHRLALGAVELRAQILLSLSRGHRAHDGNCPLTKTDKIDEFTRGFVKIQPFSMRTNRICNR
jgi:hypothetical protein